jgi:Tol biopolymer transport system component
MTKDARPASGNRFLPPGGSELQRRAGLRNLAFRGALALAAGLLCIALPSSPFRAQGGPPVIELVSQTSAGFSAEGNSNSPALSSDGRFVAFASSAGDLVSPRVLDEKTDVFVRDRGEGRNQQITKSFDGSRLNADGNPGGFAPSISADGCYVAFFSAASNLVPDDTNGRADVFVYDRSLDLMERVTVGAGGQEANGSSNFPRLSADGRYVVFQSQASNLVDGDTNGVTDVFLFDREGRTTQRVSVAADGGQANGFSLTPAISGDGRVVAFASAASNLVDGDSNGAVDIFVREWESGTTERVSVNSAGVQANGTSFLPDLTFDGGLVAFKSEAFNLVPGDTNGWPDVFVRDRTSRRTERVSVDSFGNQSNGLSSGPAIDDEGRFVVFASYAENFDPDDGNRKSDVFVVDRLAQRDDGSFGKIERVSVEMPGNPRPNDNVPDFPPSISGDGRWIGFASGAEDLVDDDFNNSTDAFVACNPFDATACAQPTPTPQLPCIGDCNGDGQVKVEELIRMIGIALQRSICGDDPELACLAGDANCDCEITVDEIVRAVTNSLLGCVEFGSCPVAQIADACLGTPCPD